MNVLLRWTLVSLLASVLLSACVTINRYYEMEAMVNGHEVTFTLPQSVFADKNTKFMLSDIGVSTKDTCVESCVFWEMTRPLNSNVTLIEENFVKFPIRYGVTLPNMQTRIYKPLNKGRYTAVAGIAMIKNGKIVDSKQLVAGFTIE